MRYPEGRQRWPGATLKYPLNPNCPTKAEGPGRGRDAEQPPEGHVHHSDPGVRSLLQAFLLSPWGQVPTDEGQLLHGLGTRSGPPCGGGQGDDSGGGGGQSMAGARRARRPWIRHRRGGSGEQPAPGAREHRGGVRKRHHRHPGLIPTPAHSSPPSAGTWGCHRPNQTGSRWHRRGFTVPERQRVRSRAASREGGRSVGQREGAAEPRRPRPLCPSKSRVSSVSWASHDKAQTGWLTTETSSHGPGDQELEIEGPQSHAAPTGSGGGTFPPYPASPLVGTAASSEHPPRPSRLISPQEP